MPAEAHYLVGPGVRRASLVSDDQKPAEHIDRPVPRNILEPPRFFSRERQTSRSVFEGVTQTMVLDFVADPWGDERFEMGEELFRQFLSGLP